MTQSIATSSRDLRGEAAPPAGRSLSDLLVAFQEGEAGASRYLLVLRFAVVNMVAMALVAAAWMQGWIGAILAADTSHLVLVIVGVFLAGLVLCTRKILQTSRELNEVKGFDPVRAPRSRVAAYCRSIEGRDAQSRTMAASALRLKLSSRIATVRHVAGRLDPEVDVGVQLVRPADLDDHVAGRGHVALGGLAGRVEVGQEQHHDRHEAGQRQHDDVAEDGPAVLVAVERIKPERAAPPARRWP